MLAENADLVAPGYGVVVEGRSMTPGIASVNTMEGVPPLPPEWVPNTYSCGIPPLTHGWIYWFVNWPSNVRGVGCDNVNPTTPILKAEVDVNSIRVMHQYYSIREGVPVPDEAGPLVGYVKCRHGDGVVRNYAIHYGLIDS